MSAAGATHVALLRGVNIGRAKRVAMGDLRTVFTGLGYGDVRTLLQSGNVVFTSAGPLAQGAAAVVTAELVARTGVQAEVLLLSAEDLTTAADENPLVDVATDPSRLIVTFLAAPPDLARLRHPDPAALAPEAVRVGTRAVYQWLPDGVLASRVPKWFWQQFEPPVTARNWRTVTRLVDLVRPGARPG